MHKHDFPIFDDHKELIYLNSAATTQKPGAVIDSVSEYYRHYNANVHRGSDALSITAENIYNEVREKVAGFLNARVDEIVFTKSCTESINVVANGLYLDSGDKVVVTVANHHSNFVPWKMLEKKGVKVEVLDIDENGEIILDEDKIKGARLLAVTHLSNVLGNLNDVKKICEFCHERDCLVLIDSAQSIGKMKIDVSDLGCDFLTFSGHKMFAINGVGVLYGRKELLEGIEPLLYGGDMVGGVTLDKIEFAEVPRKFEAGTQNIAAVYSLGRAIDYIDKIGIDEIHYHIKHITDYALDEMRKIHGLEIYGQNQYGIVSFTLNEIHSHDVAEFLSSKGISIRSGHMCCQPLIDRLGLNSACRVSFQIYNSKEEVDKLVNELQNCKEFFKK